ncbi:MAG TPA: CopG family transcriptional regulator [Thermoanaerobaculia bacterium]|jgi:hypothetical protein|nr:CopG family transcriptional regulator [Thermoanaerobaculia bacterium]
MATSMHRLQISLPESQAEFLAKRARTHGMSMAEVVRQLIQREVDSASEKRGAASLWDIAGIAEDHGPLIDDVPVSEAPELYLTGLRSRE